MAALKRFRGTGPSFADLVPYAGLVDNGVLLLKDGSLMAGWYFAGPDSESATDLERNELSRQINAVLSRLGSGWMIQVEAIRIPTTDYPSEQCCHFPDPVTQAIDAERRAHFGRKQGHFESRHALILTYRPLEPRKAALSKYIYSDQGGARSPMRTQYSLSSKTPFARSSSILPIPSRSDACKPARCASGEGREWPVTTSFCNSSASASQARATRSGSPMFPCTWTGSQPLNSSTG